MKDYYDILDVPLTASPEQIKTKYKQLVRIYHPDRFVNPTDKAYADRKLQELNDAYTALLAFGQTAETPTSSQALPIPILEPTVLDFGIVSPRQRRTGRFQVGNVGGAARQVNFTTSDHGGWFTVNKGRQLYADKPLPLEFEVTVNPTALEVGRRHGGWVEINMDGVTARVLLAIQVADAEITSSVLPRGVLALFVACLLLVAAALFSPVAESLYGFVQPLQVGSVVASAAEPNQAAPVAANPQAPNASNTSTPAHDPSDWAPIFSPDNQQIAFLSDELGSVQLFMRDPQSGRLRQLTSTPSAKSALVWSPDSTKLAFLASEAGRSEVQVVELASGVLYRLVLGHQQGEVQHFVWLADSQSIVFDLLADDQRSFYLASATGEQIQAYTPSANWVDAWPNVKS
jgi:hypothetical protein